MKSQATGRLSQQDVTYTGQTPKTSELLSMTLTLPRKLTSALLCGLTLTSGLLGLASPYGNGFGPSRYPSPQPIGQGIYFAPKEVTLYEQPTFKAPIVERLSWTEQAKRAVFSKTQNRPVLARSCFLAFYPQLSLAVLPVIQETADGWVEVYYPMGYETTAWVPLKATLQAQEPDALNNEPPHAGVYQTWFEFMRLNAKANGIYWLDGVDTYDQAIRSKPEDTAMLVPTKVIKRMRVMHVRGNWVLVEVVDFDKQKPIGWLRWRDEEGNLMMFPNFSQRQQWVLPM